MSRAPMPIHPRTALTMQCCTQPKQCVGKQCMAWVWERVPDPTYVRPTSAPGSFAPAPTVTGERGFCGLIR